MDDALKMSATKGKTVLLINNKPYKLGKIIGTGQYGRVLSAMNPEDGQLFAVKHIPIKTTPDLTEIGILKCLSHPNIIKFYDFECTLKDTFIVLEYMDSGSLLSLVNTFGPLSLSLVKKHARAILLGLQYLHSKNIIHKDLKAANVLTSSHGHTVLSDFGTSTYFKASFHSSQKQYSDVPVDEPIVGSAYWIAPEIIRMQRATPLSDIWSLGSTLVEMVTGFPPFNKKDPRHVFYILSTRDVEMDMPDMIKPILKHCFKYQGRYSATELLALKWFDQHSTQESFVKPIHHSNSTLFHNITHELSIVGDDANDLKKQIDDLLGLDDGDVDVDTPHGKTMPTSTINTIFREPITPLKSRQSLDVRLIKDKSRKRNSDKCIIS